MVTVHVHSGVDGWIGWSAWEDILVLDRGTSCALTVWTSRQSMKPFTSTRDYNVLTDCREERGGGQLQMFGGGTVLLLVSFPHAGLVVHARRSKTP